MKLVPKKWLERHGTEEQGLARRRDDFGLSRVREEIDRVFDRVLREFGGESHGLSRNLSGEHEWTTWPAIDMAEDEKAVTLRVDVPGLRPEDVSVEVSGNTLSIRGSREDEWKEEKHGIYRRERRSGSFSRTLTLPSYVDPDKIEARYDKGVMTVSIPKLPGQGRKRVPVKPS